MKTIRAFARSCGLVAILSCGLCHTHVTGLSIKPPATIILPSSATAINGVVTSGAVESVHKSDDQYLAVIAAPFTEKSDAEIVVEFGGNTVETVFSTLRLHLETRSNSPNLIQKTQLFNFIDSKFEVVDIRSVALLDERIEIELNDQVSRFVTPGSGSLLGRIQFTSDGPALFFPWECRIDRFVWEIAD